MAQRGQDTAVASQFSGGSGRAGHFGSASDTGERRYRPPSCNQSSWAALQSEVAGGMNPLELARPSADSESCDGSSDLEGRLESACTPFVRPGVTLVACSAEPSDGTRKVVAALGSVFQRVFPSIRRTLLTPTASSGSSLTTGWSLVPFENLDWIRLESPICDDGLLVPRLLVERTVWITVFSLKAHARFGLRTPMTLHAELLAVGNPLIPWPLLASEAFRVMQPDLSVAWIPVGPTGSGPGPAALLDTRSDRMELALSRMAGIPAQALPHWREISKRFRVSQQKPPEDHVVELRPLDAVDLHAVQRGAARALRRHRWRVLRNDLALAFTNLHRVPDFSRRRLQVLREKFRWHRSDS